MILEEYTYELPPELIAQAPANPRDSTRLLIYDRKSEKTSFDVFRNVTKYLPKNSVLVLNQTKVLPARLFAETEHGGKVELFYIAKRDDLIEFLARKKLKINTVLKLDQHTFTVMKQEANRFYLKPSFAIEKLFDVLKQYGHTPLPPYIKQSPLSEAEKREQYQTVFAQQEGSVAAPTASLHFTPELLESLHNAGHTLVYVTLHVNLGTFAPVTEQQLQEKKLHEEYYEISAESAEILQQAKQNTKPIIAVGTTVVRTLESAFANPSQPTLSGTTSLFIQPGYRFKMVDHLITNFHVPKSSLLMLVAALTGREKLMELYQQAINEKFRFFSFGDAMFIQ